MALTVTVVDEVTALVATVNVAVVFPAATTTLAGAVAYEALLVHSPTQIPFVGAGAVKVTVPVEELPPVTDTGLSVSELSVGTAVIVSVAV